MDGAAVNLSRVGYWLITASFGGLFQLPTEKEARRWHGAAAELTGWLALSRGSTVGRCWAVRHGLRLGV